MKSQIESFKSLNIRRALRMARMMAKHAVARAVVPQAPLLTAHERDRFMQRRLEHDDAMRLRAAAVFGKKKKLPLPTVGVFACENDPSGQLHPRVME